MEHLRQRLADLGLFSLSPEEQRASAVRLGAVGVTPDDITALLTEARNAMQPKRALAAVASLLRKPPVEVREAVMQLRERNAAVQRGSSTASCMQNVTRQNPHGWADPATIAGLDHGEPGVWNAYRQSYNLTETEMRELGTRDARRYDCTRADKP